MSLAVQAHCLQCGNLLRIPADWLNRPVRCKHCKAVFEARRKAATVGAPVAAAAPAAPAAVPTSGSHHGSASLNFADAPAAAAAGRKYGQKSFPWGVVVVGLLFFALVGVAGVVITNPERFKSITKAVAVNPAKTKPVEPAKADPPDGEPAVAPTTGVFPRRILAVSVNNYLYANPIGFGSNQRDLPALVEKLRRDWKVPPDQTAILSDGMPEGQARAPLKPVIEQAVEKFLQSSRPQDRVVLMFIGHAVELDGEGHLAPLEGDLADKKTLIPLKWVYDKLAECKAQQKLFVVDTARLDTARGTERPGSGPLSKKLEEQFKAPPKGVQVWASCSAEQYSHEFDYASFDNREVWGSAFVNLFFFATMRGQGIQRADSPLPVDLWASRVGPETDRFVQAVLKQKQTPKLYGEPGPAVAYDPKEPPPPRIDLPAVAAGSGGSADKADVRSILAEIDVPPIKIARKNTTPVRVEDVVPFSAERLKDYAADAKETPLRKAVADAVKLLRDVRAKSDQSDLPEEFRGQTSEAAKKEILAKQRRPAEIQFELQEKLEELEKVGEARDAEPKRWQANYDYVLAQVKARLAYINEYNLMLGKVRKDELPPLDPKLGHRGWRLASEEKLQSAREVRDVAAESKKLLAKVVKEHPGTPWEVMARRERFTALGLSWQATSFGSE